MSESQGLASTNHPPPAVVGKTLLLAVALGIAGALAASAYLAVLDFLQEVVWQDLPKTLGFTRAPLWFVLVACLAGAAVVALSTRLPGRTSGPLTGLHFDIGPDRWPAFALATLGTLIFGLPLGPEAPLIACGTALAALVLRKKDPKVVKLAMLLAGAAAIGAIFGNPFITAFMILEFTAFGAVPAAALLPVLVSLGTGYLVLTGLGRWDGLGTHTLSVPGLLPVDRLTPRDFLTAAIVAILAGALSLVARLIGWRVVGLAQRFRMPVLFGSAALIGLIAWGATTWAEMPLETVLFSGELGMPALIAATSASAVAIVTVAKLAVYGLALGSGFRGGPIFPAVALGVGIGVVVALIFDDSHLAVGVVAGIAASSASMLKLPFTSGMLALLITSSAGAVTAPIAILGAVVGFLIRMGWDAKRPEPASEEAAAGTPSKAAT